MNKIIVGDFMYKINKVFFLENIINEEKDK